MRLWLIIWVLYTFLADMLGAFLGLALALAVRFPGQGYILVAERFEHPFLAMFFWFALWLITLGGVGLYDPNRAADWRWAMQGLLRGGLVFAILILAGLTAFKITGVSRLFLLLAFGIQVVAAATLRALLYLWSSRRRLPAVGAARLAIIGDSRALFESCGLRASQRRLGVEVAAHIPAHKADQLGHLLDKEVVDEVLISLPVSRWQEIERLAAAAVERGKTVHVVLPRPKWEMVRPCVTTVNGKVLLSWVFGPQDSPALLIKRAMDIAGAAVGLILLAPLMAVIALAIKLDSPGPVFFAQERVGLHGRRFRMYKFRSMVADAEQRLREVAALNEMRGPVFKVRNDPRVTRVGRWLRRTSLDELPQLWNVLKGDMSLVGPRPPLPHEVNMYSLEHRRRLSIRPGLTCLWQVSGRNDIADFEDWVRLDLEYFEQWNLWLDAKILARTVAEVLAMRGR